MRRFTQTNPLSGYTPSVSGVPTYGQSAMTNNYGALSNASYSSPQANPAQMLGILQMLQQMQNRRQSPAAALAQRQGRSWEQSLTPVEGYEGRFFEDEAGNTVDANRNLVDLSQRYPTAVNTQYNPGLYSRINNALAQFYRDKYGDRAGSYSNDFSETPEVHVRGYGPNYKANRVGYNKPDGTRGTINLHGLPQYSVAVDNPRGGQTFIPTNPALSATANDLIKSGVSSVQMSRRAGDGSGPLGFVNGALSARGAGDSDPARGSNRFYFSDDERTAAPRPSSGQRPKKLNVSLFRGANKAPRPQNLVSGYKKTLTPSDVEGLAARGYTPDTWPGNPYGHPALDFMTMNYGYKQPIMGHEISDWNPDFGKDVPNNGMFRMKQNTVQNLGRFQPAGKVRSLF